MYISYALQAWRDGPIWGIPVAPSPEKLEPSDAPPTPYRFPETHSSSTPGKEKQTSVLFCLCMVNYKSGMTFAFHLASPIFKWLDMRWKLNTCDAWGILQVFITLKKWIWENVRPILNNEFFFAIFCINYFFSLLWMAQSHAYENTSHWYQWLYLKACE